MDVLDSHLHLWDPQTLAYGWLTGRLDQRFGPEEIRAAAPDGARYVFVQAEASRAQSFAEIEWAASLAEDVGIVGLIAFAPLEQGAGALSHLERLREVPNVVGVRRMLQGEEPGFALRPGFLDGLRALTSLGLTFDVCVDATQLRDVISLADAVPDSALVVDHLGKPNVHGELRTWSSDFRELSLRPNVRCKASGLPAQAGGVADLPLASPILDLAFEAFGTQRVMFGSDWPVSSDWASWEATVRTAASRFGGSTAVDDVMWRAAHDFYRLPADA